MISLPSVRLLSLVVIVVTGCASDRPARPQRSGPSRAHPDPAGALLKELGIELRLGQPFNPPRTKVPPGLALEKPERFVLGGHPAQSVRIVRDGGRIAAFQVRFGAPEVLPTAAKLLGGSIEQRTGVGPDGRVHADYFDAESETGYVFCFVEWRDPERTQVHQVLVTIARGEAARTVKAAVAAGRRADAAKAE